MKYYARVHAEEIRNSLGLKQVSDTEYEGCLGFGTFPFFLWEHSIVIVECGVYEDEDYELEDERYNLYLCFSCPTTDKVNYGFTKSSSSKDILIENLNTLVEKLNQSKQVDWVCITQTASSLRMIYDHGLGI